jgi:hypothetical protein
MSYITQLNRVLRWYQRVKKISRGIIHFRDSHFYEDELFAFFLNCYHLKDWIKEDPNAAHVRVAVEPFINSSPALSLCADLCNCQKHATLKRKPRSGHDRRLGRRFHFNLGNGPRILSIRYEIVTDDATYDAYDIAQQCIRDWQTFLSRS